MLALWVSRPLLAADRRSCSEVHGRPHHGFKVLSGPAEVGQAVGSPQRSRCLLPRTWHERLSSQNRTLYSFLHTFMYTDRKLL